MSIEKVQQVSYDMILDDGANQEMFAAMDNFHTLKWDLPSKLADLQWVHKMVNSDPYDALRNGASVYSSLEPRLKISPLAPNPETMDRTDDIERALRWHFRNAMKRRGRPLFQLMTNAMLYDRVFIHVAYLPAQEKALAGLGGQTLRKRQAERFGPYALIVRSPREVFAEHSDWMMERVVSRTVMPVQEAVDFWGKNSELLSNARMEKGHLGHEYVTVYDYMDYDRRVVWAVLQEQMGSAADANAPGVTLLDEKHDMPFLPWVAVDGGKVLEPLLYPVYKTGAWETQNIVDTIMTSEVIAYAAAPRMKVSGPTDNVNIEYGEPGRAMHVPPGHEAEPMLPPVIDQNLSLLADRLGQRIGNSTVPKVLQGEFPSGVAFSTANLATQSGIKKINPYKELTEDALEMVFRRMLEWIDYTGDTINAYPALPEDAGMSQVSLTKGDFDVDNLYIEVELTADVPTDRMARINAALQATQMDYPTKRALEEIGVEDPGAAQKAAKQERADKVQEQIENMRAMEQEKLNLQIESERRIALARVELEQEIAAMQQQPQQQQNGGRPPSMSEQLRNPQVQGQFAQQRTGFENTQGQGGFVPPLGGTPPEQANPGGTSLSITEGV